MEIKDLFDTGSAIMDAVNDAVSSNDYSALSGKIRDSLQEASEAMKNAGRGFTPGSGAKSGDSSRLDKEKKYWQDYQSAWYLRHPESAAAKPSAKPKEGSTFFLRSGISRNKGLVPLILGVTGDILGGFGILSFLVIGLLMSVAGTGYGFVLAGFLFYTALLGAGIFATIRGVTTRQLVKKYFRYAELVGDQEYFSISDLAKQVSAPDELVRTDLSKMIRAGYLKDARFDKQQKTLMLTGHVYELYQNAERGRIEREQEAAREEEQKAHQYDDLPEEAAAIMKDGDEYIRRVRKINDVIPDTDEMSTKLYKIEDTMRAIFAQLRRDPSAASGLRRFMNYYLPTMMKLLNAYVDLDRQSVSTENVQKTKQEIRDSLDTIQTAYEKLFNDLFQNKAWDIQSDISVMKTIMERDGLVPQEGENK